MKKANYPKSDSYLTVLKSFVSGLSITYPLLWKHHLGTIIGFIIGLFIGRNVIISWKKETGSYLLWLSWLFYSGSFLSGNCIGFALFVWTSGIYYQNIQLFWLSVLLGLGVLFLILLLVHLLRNYWDAQIDRNKFVKQWIRRFRKKYGKKVAKAFQEGLKRE